MKRISRLLRQLIPEKTKRAVRRKVDRFVARKGYPRIDRAHPVDFRDLVASPLEALERAPGYPVLVSVPVERCRGLGLMAFPLSSDSPHPHVMTARSWQRDRQLAYEDSPLAHYYHAVTPHTAADVLGLPGAECTPTLAAMDALCATLPWIGVPGTVARLRRLQLSRNEMWQYG
ncbi:MAG: hypothetical protein EA403_15245 [Spirochaetaceae bacterium]|nr:MAG: hypothetical protein EA403_15245 [Spirochaetaceae bacterium]